MIVVTGSPRSGTTFVARALGWPHESAYRLTREGDLSITPSSEPEVSWLAAPFMRPGDPVIHLVRHPRTAVASIVARAFLHEEEPYGRFAYEHTGTFDPWLFWLRWTEMAADVAQATIHLESLAGNGPALNASPAPPAGVEVPSRLRPELERAAGAFGYDLDAPGL